MTQAEAGSVRKDQPIGPGRSTPTDSEKAVTVLVVDDDRDIQRLLARTLEAEGFAVAVAADARRDGPAVILLSALGDEGDRITGLEAGAGHYLAKPCSAREVVATLRAALRARQAGEPLSRRRYLFKGWCLDAGAHELTDPTGLLVTLTDGEFALLRSLVQRPRRVLSRETLLDLARGPDADAFDRAVDTQVSRIRRKLRAPGDELIRTVRNEGYLFTPVVAQA